MKRRTTIHYYKRKTTSKNQKKTKKRNKRRRIMGGATPEDFVKELKKGTFSRFKKQKTYFNSSEKNDAVPCKDKDEDKKELKSMLETNFSEFINTFVRHYKTRNQPKNKQFKLFFDSYGAVDDNLTIDNFPNIEDIQFSEEELDQFLNKYCEARPSFMNCTWYDQNQKWRSYNDGKLSSVESDTKPENLADCPKCVKTYFSEEKKRFFFKLFPESEKVWTNDEHREECVVQVNDK